MSDGTESLFWNELWRGADKQRIEKYIRDFDFKPDAIIGEMSLSKAKKVCDAGCGCGVYALKLAMNGFNVSGFDISGDAIDIARKLAADAKVAAEFTTASVTATEYEDGYFDAVVCRDVIDHMKKAEGKAAVKELLRITKQGGIVYITLDGTDEEYENEPHIISEDGDYMFIDGKWKGMVFHPYNEHEVKELDSQGATFMTEKIGDGMRVKIIKRKD